MRTVEEMWEHFEQVVVPPNAGEEQKSDMKTAFFAGTFANLNEFLVATEEDDEVAVEGIVRNLQESEAFFLKICGDVMREKGIIQ